MAGTITSPDPRPRSGRREDLDGRRLTWSLALLTLLLSRPFGAPLPHAGLDPSWMLGINWADDRGLRFGRDITFTYGPWGWLTTPVSLDVATVLVSGAFCSVAVVVLWWAIARAASPAGLRFGGAVVATPLTPIVLVMTGASWVLALGLFTCVVRGLVRGERPSIRLVAVVAASAALLVMVKFSEGVLLGGLTGLLVLSCPAWKRVAVAAAAYVVTFVVLWRVAGGSLVDIPAWLMGSLDEVAGYGDAMSLSASQDDRYLLAGVCLGVLCVWSLRSTRENGCRSMTWAQVAVAALLAFALRQGFTREDGPHVVAYFTALVVPAVQWSRYRPRRHLRQVALVAAAVVVLSYPGAWTARTARTAWADTARFVLDSRTREGQLSAARTDMRAQYSLSGHVLHALGNRPIAIDPVEIGVAWAYGLPWRPTPVLQPYAAYTAKLDTRNARGLLARPRMAVLREDGTVDTRVHLWDTPSYNLTMACFFREADQDDRWTLLVRTRSRCGAAVGGPAVEVSAGQTVPVPRAGPGDLVTMRFTPQGRTVGQAFASAVLKDPRPLQVRLDGAWVRLPRGLASGPLIVRLPVSVGWQTAADRSAATASTVAFSTAGTVQFSSRRVS